LTTKRERNAWEELDRTLRWASAYNVQLHQELLENEMIADAHSHPGRSKNGETAKAVHRAWQLIERYRKPQEEDLDHD